MKNFKKLLIFAILLTISITTVLNTKQNMPEIKKTLKHGKQSCIIRIQQGDITKSDTQAIVNAANEQLMAGAGVCGAIFKAAGYAKLTQACNTYPEKRKVRCPVGKARITKSFNLKAHGITHIIHAVGPDCRIITNPKEQDFLLKQTYKNSLLLADKSGIQSITFPFISSGIYGFPKQRAARIALEAIQEQISKNQISNIKEIHFSLFSQEDFDLFCTTIQSL